MYTFEVIAHTALCKALCFLLCKKLEILSYTEPTNPENFTNNFPFYSFCLQKILVESNLPHSLIYGEQFCCVL